MLDKIAQAWQAHTALAIVSIFFGFVLVSMFYKWRMAATKAKKGAAKARVEQASKAAASTAKKKRERYNSFVKWSFGLAVIVSLVFAIYFYLRPF